MRRIGIFLLAVVLVVAVKTYSDVTPLGARALSAFKAPQRARIVDRNGVPLAVSYQNALNDADIVPLYAVPPLLRDAFLMAEDRRFFSHHGVDWQARAAALWQNMRSLRAVRGASTISEQVVRILHPRPRTLWSRWIEGFEAAELERHADKAQILEFYMNQVPYTANRRGIAQAARYYFNREVATLTPKEMLALAVLPRAPSAYDLYRRPGRITPAIMRLVEAMTLPEQQRSAIAMEPFVLDKPELQVDAGHFVDYVRENTEPASGKIVTTLDAHLQREAEMGLRELLHSLKGKQAHNGAIMVADHRTGEIMVWANAGDAQQAMDAIRQPRQPGSAMKPFLYALALDSGWNPATLILDAPMAEEINYGLHRFNNYSHMFYGQVTLREALGNSLNIPALHTIERVGVGRYLATLHELGMQSLTESADFYNEGLALGDGEVTLFEMVQGYAALANRGRFRPLAALLESPQARPESQIYSEEAASLIGNILSDPWARQWEFGAGSVLSLPVQTAVKTGTSTDYHDAWAIGFNSRYVVGVWVGNLDGSPMDGVTGSTGPALALRSMFASLADDRQTAPLYLSPRLEKRNLCVEERKAGAHCFMRTEYFMPGSQASGPPPQQEAPRPALVRPTDGLLLAYDPRIPRDRQAFEFVAQGIPAGQAAHWMLNGELAATTREGRYLWPLRRGHFHLTLAVEDAHGNMRLVDSASFYVK